MQSLRDIIQSTDRHTTAEQQVALEAITRELADRQSAEGTNRTFASTVVPRTLGNEDYWERQGSTSPASVARERRRDFRPGPRLERGGNNRQRDRLTRMSRSEQLASPSTNVPRLTPLNIARTPTAATENGSDAQSSRDYRHPKRRKLDDGTFDDGQQQLPDYGFEGMLKPANLRMKVLDDSDSSASRLQSYEPSKLNLWSADNQEIYRSKRRKVNILMQHQGGWPFNLSKLVIKLPRHDYDASPLQGMVFVSMHDQNLVEKTAYYETLEPISYMFHPPPPPRRYDSYRPPQDYPPPPRSPPFRRPRRPQPNLEPHDAQWTDPDMIEEPAEIPYVQGFNITYDHIPDDEPDSPLRSPRIWHDPDYEYTRRQYFLQRADRYRPSYTNEERRRWQAGAVEADDYEQDDEGSEPPSDSDDEDVPLYRGVPPAEPRLTEAERNQHDFLDRMRAGRGRVDQNEPFPRLGQYAAIRHGNSESNARSASPDRIRRRPEASRFQARTVRPFSPVLNPRPASAKRLPGCDDMLRGRSATASSDSSDQEVVPYARFQVADNGSLAINFEPAV